MTRNEFSWLEAKSGLGSNLKIHLSETLNRTSRLESFRQIVRLCGTDEETNDKPGLGLESKSVVKLFSSQTLTNAILRTIGSKSV